MALESPDQKLGLQQLRKRLWDTVSSDVTVPKDILEVTSEGWTIRVTQGEERWFCWLDGHGYKGSTDGVSWRAAVLRMIASLDEMLEA